MGPPTISADQQLKAGRCLPPREASMGPPTISADQRNGRGQYGRSVYASMGPPTISADQLRQFGEGTLVNFVLQWGRRRSRRINIEDYLRHYADDPASMGPPTISADQRPMPQVSQEPTQITLQWGRRRSRRINRVLRTRCLSCLCFNGAADDLGGSTYRLSRPM